MSANSGIYLDANAAAPLKPEVIEILKSYSFLANPSSVHSFGRRAKRALAEAREKVAYSLGGPEIDPEQLVFTSSGTEANQIAIWSVLSQAFSPAIATGLQPDPASSPHDISPDQRPHWITTSVEHDSVRQMIEWFEGQGGQVSYIPVLPDGSPDLEQIPSLVMPSTRLISMVWVNNETGVITPSFSKLCSWAQSKGIPVHIDAAQAWGKFPIRLQDLHAQWVSFSGHKIGALPGIGLLWVNRGNRVHALVRGKQEKGRRGGTENLLGIISLGAAASGLDPLGWSARVAPCREWLEKEIKSRIPGAFINGEAANRVANTLNVSFSDVKGEGLVLALDLAGYSVSAGSACSSGALEPSHVLLAMGRSKEEAVAAIRISLVDALPVEVMSGFVEALEKVVLRIRSANHQSNSRKSIKTAHSAARKD